MRLLFSLLFFFFCMTIHAKDAASNLLYMLVGTSGANIYVYRFDENSGSSEYVSKTEARNPSFLAISSDERYVYSVGTDAQKKATAFAFSFDKKAGQLTLLNAQQTMSPGPCHIATDRAGRFVVTANYSGGTISLFALSTDGSLQPVAEVFEFAGTGPDPNRQNKPYLHCAIFSPDQRYLFAADLGGDQLHKFTVNDTVPFLTKGNPIAYKVEPGSGPRHFTFHSNGRFAYLINELSGMVTVFHHANGHLEAVQYIASDTSPGVGGKGSADIHISPDGKFLYASNRANTNNIAIFSIHATDGKLTFVGDQPTGLHPRNFIITPNGKYLLAANRDSNQIQVFEINRETGLLQEQHSGEITEIERPMCIKFISPE